MNPDDESTVADALARRLPIRDVVRGLGPPDGAAATLARLARDRDPDVRAWVIDATAFIEPRAAGPILVGLASDPDPDVSMLAVTKVVDLGLPVPDELVALLKRRIRLRDPHVPTHAAFVLALLSADGAADAIEAMIAGPAFPWHAADGSVALMILSGDEARIYQMLSRHERHEWTRPLLRAAYLLGGSEARAAVQRLADAHPDEQCVRQAQNALSQMDGARFRTPGRRTA